MANKVVSVRIQPQTLADIYNFLSIACEYNVANLPVSRGVQLSLENMMRWVRQSIDLPTYDTDEEALSAVRGYINKIPSAYIEKTDRPALIHTQASISEATIDSVMTTNNKEEVKEIKEQQPLTIQERAAAIEAANRKKDSLINLIDQFREKGEKEEKKALLGAIKTESIYKK